MFKNKFIILILIFTLFSCQKTEKLNDFTFDYGQLSKISINANHIEILNSYEPKIDQLYIDHSLSRSPNDYLIEWFGENVKFFGLQNKFVINILNASIKKNEILNEDLKNYKEKKILMFEIVFLVEFILYDDSNSILANSIVEAKRTTTSSKYISIYENERIIDNLIFDCLFDFSNKAEELIKEHMSDFIL